MSFQGNTALGIMVYRQCFMLILVFTFIIIPHTSYNVISVFTFSVIVSVTLVRTDILEILDTTHIQYYM